jgi:hypothetical protein
VEDEQGAPVRPYAWLDTSGLQVGVRLPNVQWRLYVLNEDQLAELEKGANSLSLGLLGLFGGIAFSALTTIATVDLSERAFGAFMGTFVGSAGLSLWFSYQTWREIRSLRALTARVREQHAR